MQTVQGIAAVAFLLVIVGAMLSLHMNRGRSLLDRWADENGYEILEADYRWMLRGPFFFRSNDKNAVYRITVRDLEGDVRRGYARCGGFWFGMWLSPDVTVEWDD
ncbi:MAG: hypothetical protein IT436_00235 [Phycisphaerales bacterium]|nr:hypothetical protein [Phycisphaerales bacterium]